MDGTQTVNLNQNTADCIKAVNNIGTTIYTNICNGSENVVHWGGLDWVGFCIVATFFGVVALGLLLLISTWFTVGFLKALSKDV